MDYGIGIDIGGTNLKAVAMTAEGERLRQATEPTAEEANALVAAVDAQIARLEAEVGRPAAAVGVAAPGFAARDGRSIAWMQGRVEAVQGVDWTDRLGGTRFIPLLNDGHAALLGEAWLGAAAGLQDVLMLTLGTGVGGGALVGGRLLRGHIGRGAHFGHLCLDPDGAPDITGTPGSLEDAVGECTLITRTDGRYPSTDALVRAHRAGDAEATAIWMRTVRNLACGLTSLINALDPEAVVLGGGIARAGDALLVPLQRELDAVEWRPLGGGVRLLMASLGEWAGAVGAARHALQRHGPSGE